MPPTDHPLPLRATTANFQAWLDEHTPTEDDRRLMADRLAGLPHQPVISVLMPVFNPVEDYLREAIDSVLAQIYPHWQLCIADDSSTATYVRPLLEGYAATDDRIHVTFRTEPGQISTTVNSALALASGDFVVCLDQDDVLTAHALCAVALALNDRPDADMLYSDHDCLSADYLLQDPCFKPDWSPDTFLSWMYTGHLSVYRRSLVNAVGGFRLGYEGAQEYDLGLRLTEMTQQIIHIPDILYHQRICEDAFFMRPGAPMLPAIDAGERALRAALQRRGDIAQVVKHPTMASTCTIRYAIQRYDRVSIIIPTRDMAHLLAPCLESIFTITTYPDYEVIVIDNGSMEPATLELFATWQAREPQRFHCIRLDIPFNYPTLNNYAVEQTSGGYLLFLNNDTTILHPDWMSGMVEQAQRPTIGAIGATLLYPDDKVQHAGVQVHGSPNNIQFSHGYVRNWSAVTAACLMCRRSVFEEVGGFDEALAITFNDVDLCLKMLKKGYYNICLPHVVLYHHESKSRGREDTAEKVSRCSQEIELFMGRWLTYARHDPYFSRHYIWKADQPNFDYSLSVVVLWQDPRECLDLWERNMDHLTHAQMIFIDNCSPPEGAKALREFCDRHPITLIRNETPLGFADAHNQGVAIATGTFILHLNSNVEIVDLPWAFLCAAAREGIAGCGPCYTESGIRYVEGWALCINRHTLQRLGGWIETDSAAGQNDADLCDRATRAGYSMVAVPALKELIRPSWEDASLTWTTTDDEPVFEQVVDQLTAVNLIIFPDWQQPDDGIHESLMTAMGDVITHPDLAELTLLVYADDIDTTDASLVIGGTLMSLVVENDIDLDVEPQIVVIGAFESAQWKRLATRLTARIALSMENHAAIAASGLANLPVYHAST